MPGAGVDDDRTTCARGVRRRKPARKYRSGTTCGDATPPHATGAQRIQSISSHQHSCIFRMATVENTHHGCGRRVHTCVCVLFSIGPGESSLPRCPRCRCSRPRSVRSSAAVPVDARRRLRTRTFREIAAAIRHDLRGIAGCGAPAALRPRPACRAGYRYESCVSLCGDGARAPLQRIARECALRQRISVLNHPWQHAVQD